MPESISLGPLLMNGGVLARIIAGLGAWLIVRRWAIKRGCGETADVLANVLLTTAVFWRFGWIFYDPGVIRESPRALLLMSGSAREAWTGLLLGAVYAAIACRRRGIPWGLRLDAVVLAGLCYVAIQSALTVEYGRITSMPWGLQPVDGGLRYHPVHLYRAALLGAAVYGLMRRDWPPGSGRYAAGGVLAYGLAGLAASFFDREAPLALLLTYDQIMAVLAVLLGYVGLSLSILKKVGNERAKEGRDPTVNDATINSKEQELQAKQNKQLAREGKDQVVDKKLDRPNRPAE
jgi:hypothetical protein